MNFDPTHSEVVGIFGVVAAEHLISKASKECEAYIYSQPVVPSFGCRKSIRSSPWQALGQRRECFDYCQASWYRD